MELTRRGLASVGLFGWLALAMPDIAGAAAQDITSAVETAHGKVRGIRRAGVSSYFAVPYGGDTAAHRFQRAGAPKSWAGVRDCLQWGNFAPQGSLSMGGQRMGPGTNPEMLKIITSIFKSGIDIPIVESEDCLTLNIFTPEATTAKTRPVMVWLHGGGFALGSANNPQYDGSALARRGDVVVVSINHRLNALGYLYLGGLHDDYADSGNIGQLDIILALRWVRDNIAAFGGDPSNVTIFGESGGGSKVGCLLAMPPAKGLFHKAIEQSGPAVHMVDRADAEEIASRTLAALGIAKADVHKLQQIDFKAVINAASAIDLGGGAGLSRKTLAPCVDGRALPRHPFDPDAPTQSRDITLMIGTVRDEQTLFMLIDPLFGEFTQDSARDRFKSVLGDRGEAAFELYRAQRPSDRPTYWVVDLMTDLTFRTGSIQMAERKARQGGAPVFMYRLDFEPPIAGGILRAPHGLDTAMAFDNVKAAPNMYGDGAAAQKIADKMATAWINFARSGTPSQAGLAWPGYDLTTRKTMIFDVDSHIASDPDSARRRYWS